MIVSLLGTFVVYFLTIVLFKSILHVAFIMQDYVWLKILCITLISWLPFFLFKKIKARCFPGKIEQLRDFNTGHQHLKKDDLKNENSNMILLS